EEAGGDQLLGAALCVVGAPAAACEEPEHDATGERFDQAVGAEANQGDRAGGDAGCNGDRELNDVPADSAPGKQSRSLLKSCPLDRGRTEWLDGNAERPRGAQLKQPCLLLRHEPSSSGLPA